LKKLYPFSFQTQICLLFVILFFYDHFAGAGKVIIRLIAGLLAGDNRSFYGILKPPPPCLDEVFDEGGLGRRCFFNLQLKNPCRKNPSATILVCSILHTSIVITFICFKAFCAAGKFETMCRRQALSASGGLLVSKARGLNLMVFANTALKQIFVSFVSFVVKNPSNP